MKNRLLFRYTIAISGLFMLILFAGYTAGYRLGAGLVLTREQEVIITNIPNDAKIFSDYALRTGILNNTISISLIPGNHMLLASAKGYWPWKYMVTVPESKSITVRAFLIPRVPKGKILNGNERLLAKKKIASVVLPTPAQPLTFTNECMSLATSGNQVIATPLPPSSSCTPPPYLCSKNTCSPTIIFSSAKKITGLIPYPGRDDAILIEIGNTIYALSIDPRAPRTFAPLLKGISPRMAQGKDNTLFVQDEKTIYQLTL
ncbi:MAG TPA: hypothetical protein ENI56_01685 [Candidatus Kaiserbacteria bacterium]|nr:hypothetical protein [Candidatus Kaiserbacteria bacterium]